MPATTPPKGRPTAGRRDRNLATRRQRSRGATKKFMWAVMALSVVIAVIVLGSGSGGNANINGGANTNVVFPALLTLRLSKLRWVPGPRS